MMTLMDLNMIEFDKKNWTLGIKLEFENFKHF